MNRKQAENTQAESTERQRQLRIEQQIALIRADRDGAQQELGGISFRLVEAPNDPALLAHIEALEREIIEHSRNIERLERAKAEAQRLDTAEAKRASLQRQADLYAGIEERTERQKVLAAQMVATVESLAPVLAEFDVIAQDNAADTWSLLKSACGSVKVAERHFDGIVRAVRGSAAVPGVVSALWASGLGRTGLSLAPWVDITQIGAIRPLDEEMELAAHRVLSKLSDLMARRKAEVLGTAPAAKVPDAADRFIPGGKKLEEAKQESFKQ